MKPIRYAILVAVALMVLSCGCHSNPLVRPFDTATNETIVPDYERLLADMNKLNKAQDDQALAAIKAAAAKYNDDFVLAKKLEIQALRELLQEAKGEADE